MSLEVPTPDPPPIDSAANPEEYEGVTVVAETNYRREELAEFLVEGAWEEAFRAWAKDTEVSRDEFAVILDLGLIESFDFFWDDFANRVGFYAPGIPEDWRERELHPSLDSWGRVSSINAGLTELGQQVCDVLKAEYIDWEAAYEPPDDLPDFSD